MTFSAEWEKSEASDNNLTSEALKESYFKLTFSEQTCEVDNENI